jgi:hypothetical protein
MKSFRLARGPDNLDCKEAYASVCFLDALGEVSLPEREDSCRNGNSKASCPKQRTPDRSQRQLMCEYETGPHSSHSFSLVLSAHFGVVC